MMLNKNITIDSSYISNIFNNYKTEKLSKLDSDLDSICGVGGKVYLKRPLDTRLGSLFYEIRSRVAAKGILGGYAIFAETKIDYEVIKLIMGSDNTSGSYETGIVFKIAA
ncbi:MAG: hypothetical protein ACP5NV_02300 [Candidatus Woesearchaeota archaeon]